MFPPFQAGRGIYPHPGSMAVHGIIKGGKGRKGKILTRKRNERLHYNIDKGKMWGLLKI
jgi:hypothetical protein